MGNVIFVSNIELPVAFVNDRDNLTDVSFFVGFINVDFSSNINILFDTNNDIEYFIKRNFSLQIEINSILPNISRLYFVNNFSSGAYLNFLTNNISSNNYNNFYSIVDINTINKNNIIVNRFFSSISDINSITPELNKLYQHCLFNSGANISSTSSILQHFIKRKFFSTTKINHIIPSVNNFSERYFSSNTKIKSDISLRKRFIERYFSSLVNINITSNEFESENLTILDLIPTIPKSLNGVVLFEDENNLNDFDSIIFNLDIIDENLNVGLESIEQIFELMDGNVSSFDDNNYIFDLEDGNNITTFDDISSESKYTEEVFYEFENLNHVYDFLIN